MKRKFLQVSVPFLIFLVSACGSAGTPSIDQPVDRQTVIDLVCGTENQVACVSAVCADEDACPLFSALSSQAVFDFVQTYSQCEDCNTPKFQPELGIGKCIEYRVAEKINGWTVTFNVSESCSFRYGSPAESRIMVDVKSADMQIGRIQPPIAYIKDPSYCQSDHDCYCLSGSGVPFMGCSNLLYAPLNWSGYYAGEACGCVSNWCTEK
jgi:hypothetical protein